MTSRSQSASLPAGTVRLVINEPTPSGNALQGWHWRRKLREREKWGWLLKAAMLDARIQPLVSSTEPWRKVSARIDRWGPRVLDDTNFRAGLKWLEDALIAEGFAKDDSPKHWTLDPHQHIGKPYRTEILVEVAV